MGGAVVVLLETFCSRSCHSSWHETAAARRSVVVDNSGRTDAINHLYLTHNPAARHHHPHRPTMTRMKKLAGPIRRRSGRALHAGHEFHLDGIEWIGRRRIRKARIQIHSRGVQIHHNLNETFFALRRDRTQRDNRIWNN